jgi:hypothetical protein
LPDECPTMRFRMRTFAFGALTARIHTPPIYLSSDYDPLYRFHPWQANPRILDVTEIKTVAYVPTLLDFQR